MYKKNGKFKLFYFYCINLPYNFLSILLKRYYFSKIFNYGINLFYFILFCYFNDNILIILK